MCCDIKIKILFENVKEYHFCLVCTMKHRQLNRVMLEKDNNLIVIFPYRKTGLVKRVSWKP